MFRCACPEICGFFVTAFFLLLSVFEGALALGVQFPSADDEPHKLPAALRCASIVACFLWVFAALIVVQRSGLLYCGLSADFVKAVTHGLASGWSLCTILHLSSSNPLERWGWSPVTLILAIVCWVLARHKKPKSSDDVEEDYEFDNEEVAVELKAPLLNVV